MVARLQSNDLSLKRFEQLQKIIQELKSETNQLKEEKATQGDQLQKIHDHSNQVDIENNQLVFRMKQLKDLFEQREQTIRDIFDKMNKARTSGYRKNFNLHPILRSFFFIVEFEDLLSNLRETLSHSNQDFLSSIDNDVKRSGQRIRNLHHEIDEKAHRIKELELLFKHESDRCREIETKLKVVLELREHDSHLQIRQLGRTDTELRKARTDSERARILQQQVEFKQ